MLFDDRANQLSLSVAQVTIRRADNVFAHQSYLCLFLICPRLNQVVVYLLMPQEDAAKKLSLNMGTSSLTLVKNLAYALESLGQMPSRASAFKLIPLNNLATQIVYGLKPRCHCPFSPSLMTKPIIAPKVDEADAHLIDLFQNIQEWEGNLAGGTPLELTFDSKLAESGKLKKGAKSVASLFETKISFGDPRDRLMRLTEDTFAQSGTELDPIYQQQMQGQFDFYYMTLSVALISKPGARFWRLTCQLEFEATGGAIVQTIFPTDQWRSVLNFGVGMDAGLNGNLDWSAGVDSSQLAEFIALLPEGLKAKAVGKNEFKGFIGIPSFKYELGHPEILAVGENNSFCYWRIQDQDLQKVGTAKFAVVFKVPKGTESIILQGTAWADPDINWLTADVRDVFSALSGSMKNLLKQKNGAASQFARGAAEEWTLALP